MILWKFKETPETRPGFTYCKAFRKVIDVDAWKWGISIGLVNQYQRNSDDVWASNHADNFEISLTSKWRWGRNDYYWDGTHSYLDLGFLHVQYVPRDTKES